MSMLQRMVIGAALGLLAAPIDPASAAPMSYTLKDLGAVPSDPSAGNSVPKIDDSGLVSFLRPLGPGELPGNLEVEAPYPAVASLYQSVRPGGPYVGNYTVELPNGRRSGSQAFYWDGSGPIEPLRHSLPGEDLSAWVESNLAMEVNRNGVAVGFGGPEYAAMMWARSSADPSRWIATTLGQMKVAHAINDGGQIVGWGLDDRYTSPFNVNANRAFLYENGEYVSLNGRIDPNLGWLLEAASGINNSGQIVGRGVNAQGQYRYFELTPNVPEPAAIWSFGILAAFAGHHWVKGRVRAR